MMLVGDKVKSHEIEVSTLSMLHQSRQRLGRGIISQYPVAEALWQCKSGSSLNISPTATHTTSDEHFSVCFSFNLTQNQGWYFPILFGSKKILTPPFQQEFCFIFLTAL